MNQSFQAVFCLFCLLIPYGSMAQNQHRDSVLSDIDQQIWHPFIRAYHERNARDFNALHSEEVLRITDRGIRIGAEYRDAITQSFSMEGQPAQEIELRFEQRILRDEVACETGMYQVTQTLQDGSTRHFYGRFQVILRKEDGRWLITQDYDTSVLNGEEIGLTQWNRLE